MAIPEGHHRLEGAVEPSGEQSPDLLQQPSPEHLFRPGIDPAVQRLAVRPNRKEQALALRIRGAPGGACLAGGNPGRSRRSRGRGVPGAGRRDGSSRTFRGLCAQAPRGAPLPPPLPNAARALPGRAGPRGEDPAPAAVRGYTSPSPRPASGLFPGQGSPRSPAPRPGRTSRRRTARRDPPRRSGDGGPLPRSVTVGFAVPMSKCRYTWRESALTISSGEFAREGEGEGRFPGGRRPGENDDFHPLHPVR